MLNLLPQAKQKALKREYVSRLAAVALFAIAALFCFAIAAFLPAFFLAHKQEAALISQNGFLKKEIESVRKESPSRILKETLKRAEALQNATSSPRVHELILAVLKEKPRAISLTGFESRLGESGKQTMTLRGRALNRNALLSFSKSLEDKNEFSKVDVPVSNFAASEDLSFSIFMEVKQEPTK